jgi:late competence protein required for DNA uptake (superfamily II DNA/RNA helicase)
MAIKRTKWDAVFSNYIRYRDNWTCQKCGKKYHERSAGLHCSHFYGRRSWATRLEPANAMALCYSCHIYVGSFPMEHVDLWESRFTKKETDYVNSLHRNSKIKKRDIANDETYQKLRRMLDEEKNKGFVEIK